MTNTNFENLLCPEKVAVEGLPWKQFANLQSIDRLKRIYSDDLPDYWAAVKYDDIIQISRNEEVFGPHPQNILRSKIRNETRFNSKGRLLRELELLEMTGRAHLKARRTIAKLFSNKSIESYGIFISKLISKDSAWEGMDYSLVDGLASEIPSKVIVKLLELNDWENQVVSLGHRITKYSDVIEFPDQKRAAELLVNDVTSLNSIFEEYIQTQKRKKGSLVHYFISTDEFSTDQIKTHLITLLIGGNDTTKHAISGAIDVFSRFPEQLSRLRENPHLIHSAVEEVFRWTSPTTHFLRRANESTVVSNTVIQKGDTVALIYPAGNRDHNAFSNPHSFDIGRQENKQLAFGGFGRHHCLGLNLAKLELRLILEHLAKNVDSIRVLEEPKRIASIFFNGLKDFKVSFCMRG